MSASAVSQPLSAKQEHIPRSCISPARYSCISTAIRNESESIPGPHSRVDQAGISTAKAVYKQQSKTKTKSLLVDTAASTWAVSQPRTAKQKHPWRSCIHQRGIAVYEQQSKFQAKALLDETVVSTRAVYQPRKIDINSNQK